ncbi:MAG: tetratricopeptide repeat protein [Bacteroidota bacterium]
MKRDVTDFEKEVLALSHTTPVLVDFWAEWCGPCRILGPVLDRLAEKHAGEWELKKVDTEALPDVAARYGIRSIPNVKLFSDGTVIDEFIGALPEGAVEAWLAKALPDKHRKEILQAETLLREGKRTEAAGVLEHVVADSPQHDHARALLAITLVFENLPRAVGLVEQIHPADKDGLTAEAVRTFNHLLEVLKHPDRLPEHAVQAPYLDAIRSLKSGEFDRALGLFLDVIRGNRFYDDDAPRRACIAIFAYLGEDHEITRKRRRELSSALYI